MKANKWFDTFFNNPKNRRDMRFSSHTFVEKSAPDARACQAADLLSYLSTHSYKRFREGKQFRKDYLALYRDGTDVVRGIPNNYFES